MENVYIFTKYSTPHIPSCNVLNISLKELRAKKDTNLDGIGNGFLRDLVLKLTVGLTTAKISVGIRKTRIIVTIRYLPKIFGYVQYIGQISVFSEQISDVQRSRTIQEMSKYLLSTNPGHDLPDGNIVFDIGAACFVQDTVHNTRKT